MSPKRDLQVTVGVGEAKFLRFNCLSPADVVVTLNSYSRGADPLLFISVDPNSMPSFGGHESSTFSHWLEDKAGVHYATAKGLGPNGGILGLMNVRNFAAEELKAVLSLRCSYVVAFDLFFLGPPALLGRLSEPARQWLSGMFWTWQVQQEWGMSMR